jgi:hypothetical protein
MASTFTSDNFITFFNTNRATIVTPKDRLRDLAREVRLPFFDVIRGMPPEMIVKGGSSIDDIVKVRQNGSFQFYGPGDKSQVNLVDTTKVISYPWAFGRSSFGWTRAEWMLATKGGQRENLKDFKRIKQNDRKAEHCIGLNSTMFRRPDGQGMAGKPADGKRVPFSLLAFISEDPVRFRPPAQNAAGTTGTLWLNDAGADRPDVAGYVPQNEPWWRNVIRQYTRGALNDPQNGIIAMIESAELGIVYQQVPRTGGVFDDGVARIGDVNIYTNDDGFLFIKQAYRNSQDRFIRKPTDAGVGADFTFDDMPFINCPQLNTENLDQTTGAGAQYQGRPYQPGEPRFILHNRQYLFPVFLDSNMMDEQDVRVSELQSDLTYGWTFTEMQWTCWGRSRQAIVAPK